jgi:hydroxymethylbilane synthase
MAQARAVADALGASGGPGVELVEVTTTGDLSSASLAQIGGTGVFVSALRDALAAGEVDLAVHSLKDLPVADPAGLLLAAVPPREDPSDVLVARDGLGLRTLPDGAVVGTGSPRRAVQLLAARPGLRVVDVRGNVDTRLSKVAAGDLDAVVLARAGLARLHRLDAVTDLLGPEVMLPAPGQGALAVECRADRADLISLLAGLDDTRTRIEVTAERALLGRLEAGCSAPVGALALLAPEARAGAELELTAVVARPGDGALVRSTLAGSLHDPGGTGRRLAELLLSEGADGLLGVRVQ